MIEHGIINVYKEKGYTSHDVAAILRKAAGTKAGHTGTLDPNAQGVLPICLGRATKLADYIMAGDKAYVAEVVLGVTTDTYDMTGEVLTRRETDISAGKFREAAMKFVGEQMQIPPMYSAVKVGGKKLYDLARKGEIVERTPRRVYIHEMRILTQAEAAELGCIGAFGGDFFIEVNCSKGTYIRSLCADIGEALGCGAAMGELTRTRNGDFLLENAVKIGDLKEASQAGRLHEHILPVDTVLPYPKATVKEIGLKMALNGNGVPKDMIEPTPHDIKKIWLYTPGYGDMDQRLIGLFSMASDGCCLRAEVML